MVVLLAAALTATMLGGPAAGQDGSEEPEEPARPAPAFLLQGSGEGHSVGLSQWGARALARGGSSYVEILQHFYTDVEVGTTDATETSDPLHVGLFHANPAVDDPTVLQLTALRDEDDGAVDVFLTPDEAPTRVPAGVTWTLAWDEGIPVLQPAGFVLQDAEGSTVARGPGPVTVSYATAGAAALRLPQITASDDSRAGTLNRGVITVTRDEESGRLHPVMRIALEEYLRGVNEMPALWGVEALKAQAVAARTFAVRRLASGLRSACGCHLGVTTADQAYAGYAQEGDPQRSAWIDAVTSTTGEGVTFDGELIDAVYSAAHAGRSENSEESWAFGGRSFPYLRSVPDPWISDPELAEEYPLASWDHELGHTVLAELTGLATVAQVDITARTIGGTPRLLSVSGWAPGGQRVEERTVETGTVGVAGADLYLAMREDGDAPPSQQIGVIGFLSFPDVRGDSPHAYNVAAIAEQGVAAGRGDGTYDPRSGVRRDQMATFLARALDLTLDPNAPDRFDDVPRNSVHRDAINAVAAAGIAQGVAERRYAPAATVTRDQMATFIARGFDLGEREEDRFIDTQNSVHRTRINAVAAEGITTGCTTERFCPRLPVTRDQMASFLARALGFGW